MSSVIGVWVSSGRQSTHSPPCEQLLTAVGVGARCLRRRAPSVVIWGCHGPFSVRRPRHPLLSSIVSSSCPGPCHPAIILIVVGVPHCLGPLCVGFLVASSSPPSSPVVLLLLIVLVLVSVPLLFSPFLVVVIPVSSPGPLSTLRAEAHSSGVGVSSCRHLVVASQLFSLPSPSASSLSLWLLPSSSLSPLSQVLSTSFPWRWWQLL